MGLKTVLSKLDRVEQMLTEKDAEIERLRETIQEIAKWCEAIKVEEDN